MTDFNFEAKNIPVLAKAGAIIPMSANDRTNDSTNPVDMELLIYRGNNTFKLYEDDGESLSYQNGAFCKTPFTVKEDGSSVYFTIDKGEGDVSVVPEKRNYKLFFKDIVNAEITVKEDLCPYVSRGGLKLEKALRDMVEEGLYEMEYSADTAVRGTDFGLFRM